MTPEIEPEQLVNYGQTAVIILIVALIGLIIYYSIRRGLRILYQQDYISESIRGGVQIVARWTILILVVLVGLQQIGVQITSVWTALSAFVVLLGVGLVAVWSVLSNILCSLLLLLFRPFSIGDKIEVAETSGGGLQGKVVNLNLLYTFILEENGDDVDTIVQIPNNLFFQKVIRRWPGRRTRSLKEIMFKDDTQSINQNVSL